MLKNQNIICISSIDWDFVWQGHQEIMATFAKNGNRVLFIENTGVRVPSFKDIPRLKKRFVNWFKTVKGFRKETENLFIYSPVILPFPYSRIARWLNRYMLLKPLRRWIKIMDFHNPIIWTFLPTGIALDIINNIDTKLSVYYCIADFYELADNPRKVKKTEDELIKKCDLIFAQGDILAEKCKRLNNNVHIFPFGVNIEAFGNFKPDKDEILSDIKGIKKPIIGYIGGIHKHIDFGLIKYIAGKHPEWSIVLIGPIQTDVSEISNLQNVFLLGKKDFFSLPNYLSAFDVGIIPYKLSEYTATVFPTKLNEYHIMGKPVVSTDLPEVGNFNNQNDNLVFVGKTYEGFINCIFRALNNGSDGPIQQRIASARRNSWIARIEEMSNLIEEAVEEKSKGLVNWQEKFLRLYRVARRKIFTLTTIFLGSYLLLFYTPFVWFIATPLKISQAPQKTDCIVVFAGGVGESGKAMQGYEERVQYAVELYKRGYAKYIIFSSGYMYVFKEPIIMKVLALSLGVPEEAIILEDNAKNTYENIKFTKQILINKGWNKILLVSSPYHMLRTSLVFNKIAKEVKVYYTPIPKSLFFFHEGRDSFGRKIWKRANLEQIKAILHEYLGIIYYSLQGYI